MVKLKRLKINKYRNVRPGTELHFDDGVNLVLGQNGSGKTTLLGLLTCVASSNFSAIADEPFDIEYEVEGGGFTAQLMVRANIQERQTEDVESPQHPIPNQRVFDYRAIISTAKTASICEIVGSQDGTRLLLVGDEVLWPPHDPFQVCFFLDALDILDAASPFAQAKDALYVPATARFDESLDAFLAMTGRPAVTVSAGTAPLARLLVSHIPERPAHAISRQFAPLGLARLVPLAHESPAGELRVSTTSAQPDPPGTSQALDFLLSAAAALGFPHAAVKPEIRTISKLPSRAATRYDVQGFTFSFSRRDGSTIHHDLLSYGQKRLLAYFYYLAATEHFVIADELVNGLHHRWIEACMDAIGERQAFLTSQNPLLFEYVKFKSVEQVQACFITCKSEVVDGAEQLVWQNMTRGDALSFFESYQADLESVGDILITRGLW